MNLRGRWIGFTHNHARSLIFKLRSSSESIEINDIDEDYKNAEKVEQFRIGNKAIYYPGMPGTWYVPYEAVTKALTRNAQLPLTGCCGKALPMVRFRVYYDGKHEVYRDFMFEKLESANRALDILLAYRPDIPYERETRPFEVF